MIRATVTVCHSCTPPELLKEITLASDIIVTASGKPGLITAEMVREGAVVVDAGFSMDANGTIRGDSDIENVLGVCGKITPPTGGVGPVTTAILLRNTVLYSLLHSFHCLFGCLDVLSLLCFVLFDFIWVVSLFLLFLLSENI